MMMILVSNYMFWGARNPINQLMGQNKEYISGNSRWRPRWPPIHGISYNFLNFLPIMIILVTSHMYYGARNPIDSLTEENNECIKWKSKMVSKMVSKMATDLHNILIRSDFVLCGLCIVWSLYCWEDFCSLGIGLNKEMKQAY